MLEASQHWKDVALLSDGAVFAQEPVWTLPYLQDLEGYIKDNGSFFDKLEKELEPTKPEVKQLATEMLWVIYLCPDNIAKSRKLGNIKLVWEWSGEPFPENSDWLADDVLVGAGNIGEGMTHIRYDLKFFIHMMIDFKSLAELERRELLSDGWKFAQWLERIPGCNNRQFRNMIVFLLFPDDFEHIFARTKRRDIVREFTGKTNAEVNKLSALEIDLELLNIRREKEKEHDTKDLDFYDSPLRELWQDSELESGPEPDIDDPPPAKIGAMEHLHPLNQILYGPPGTGKTWNTVNYAVAIIEGKSLDELEGEDREEVKERFDALKTNGQIAMVTFHQNFTYEDFIEGIRPVLDDEDRDIEYELHKGVFKEIADHAREDREQNYVLIIDEINRGNIAKIFAELITLIEPSKRIGRDDAATVILPYSQEEFGVPDNLYIIGTMNTADRSIALLDTALRRRFEFIEMMPDSKHDKISTDIEGVNCQELLAAMNKRIRFLLDREHQIGHTYFMDVDDLESLAATFKNKIIPLLQEYFYDNWEKIDLVLNRNGFIVPQSSIDSNLFKNSELIDKERKIYELLAKDNAEWETPEIYKTIYQKGQGETDEAGEDI